VRHLERLTYLHSPQISTAEIYYQHSQILIAMGQADSARQYLHLAYNETARQANLLTDETLRHDFLHNVPINRQILAAVEASSK
jgi:hypothetical protein